MNVPAASVANRALRIPMRSNMCLARERPVLLPVGEDPAHERTHEVRGSRKESQIVSGGAARGLRVA